MLYRHATCVLLSCSMAMSLGAALPIGQKPLVSRDFCVSLMANRVPAQGGGIDASGNLVGPTQEVASANLTPETESKDAFGRAVTSADLPGSAFKLPEKLTFPLTFAVSKAPRAIQTQTTSNTTGSTSHTDPTTGAQIISNTNQEATSATTGSIEGFDKTAQMWISIHKDGRLELEGQPLPEDDTKELYTACQAFMAEDAQGH